MVWIAAILFSLSAVNLAASSYILYLAHKPVSVNAKVLSAFHTGTSTNGLGTCSFCHHIVARYFVNSKGETVCANCKPAAFAAAEKDNQLNAPR